MVDEIGGEMLFSKITCPHTPKMVSFNPGLFKTLPKGSLLVCDNVLLEQLQLAITRAVEDNSFHQCGVVLVVDEETLHSKELLKSLNLRMRSIYASSTVMIKPWNGGLPRGSDGNFMTAAVGDIALRITQALKLLPGLLKNPAVKLACIHKSGRTIHNGPRAPTSPSMGLMVSTEECSFVRAVSESPTALDAVARWSPMTTPPKKTKRLNHQPKHAGSRGKGGFRGKKRGGGSSRGGSHGGFGGRGRGGH